MLTHKVTPSRSLDAAIHTRLIGPVLSLKSGVFMDGGNPVPAYTSSIDAAVSLCQIILPGWIWRLCTCSVTDDAWLMPDFGHPEMGKAFEKAWPDCRDPLGDGPGIDLSFAPSGHPALSLVTVLLLVLESLQTGEDPDWEMSSITELDRLSNSLGEIEILNWATLGRGGM